MFADEFRVLIYGIILLLIIIFMPKGIAGQLGALSPTIAKWLP
jgi:ABC-type branched-subunit amino acid transport system permease subunit